MFIEIKNTGEMDINALVLIGASTKRGDSSKIGFFGSGLKYALAVLIRNGVMPKIFIGKREVAITIEKREFRNQTFSQIYIDGEPTSLTVEMGIDWEPWFAIRELYCNAIDEGQCSLKITEDLTPEDGSTSIYVENVNNIFNELLLNWDKYFSEKRHDLMFSAAGIKAYSGDHGEDVKDREYIMYRRGVRCHHQKAKCLYHYDLVDVDINESRTLKMSYDATWAPVKMLALHADREVVKNIFDNWKDTMESHFPWESHAELLNETWLEVLGGRRCIVDLYAGSFLSEIAKGNCIVLPASLCHAMRKRWPKNVHVVGHSDNQGNYLVIEKSVRHMSYIDTARTFLFDCGYPVDMPVDVAIFEDKEVMGAAVNDRILISHECMERGKRAVTVCMLEEYIHIKYQVTDMSRAMQNLLFEKMMELYEEKTKVYL